MTDAERHFNIGDTGQSLEFLQSIIDEADFDQHQIIKHLMWEIQASRSIPDDQSKKLSEQAAEIERLRKHVQRQNDKAFKYRERLKSQADQVLQICAEARFMGAIKE